MPVERVGWQSRYYSHGGSAATGKSCQFSFAPQLFYPSHRRRVTRILYFIWFPAMLRKLYCTLYDRNQPTHFGLASLAIADIHHLGIPPGYCTDRTTVSRTTRPCRRSSIYDGTDPSHNICIMMASWISSSCPSPSLVTPLSPSHTHALTHSHIHTYIGTFTMCHAGSARRTGPGDHTRSRY